MQGWNVKGVKDLEFCVYIYFSHFFFSVHIILFSAWKHTP